MKPSRTLASMVKITKALKDAGAARFDVRGDGFSVEFSHQQDGVNFLTQRPKQTPQERKQAYERVLFHSAHSG